VPVRLAIGKANTRTGSEVVVNHGLADVEDNAGIGAPTPTRRRPGAACAAGLVVKGQLGVVQRAAVEVMTTFENDPAAPSDCVRSGRGPGV